MQALPDNLTEEESRVLRIILGFLRRKGIDAHLEIRLNRKAPRPQVFEVKRNEINSVALGRD